MPEASKEACRKSAHMRYLNLGRSLFDFWIQTRKSYLKNNNVLLSRQMFPSVSCLEDESEGKKSEHFISHQDRH